MATATAITSPPETVFPASWSLADLKAHLGGIPLKRIRLYPPPGQATEDDVFKIQDREGILCELVEGVLVEKPMGAYESLLAGFIIQYLNNYLEKHDLGVVLASSGPYRLLPGRMRMPDLSFVSWQKLPGKKFPRKRVLDIAPDLAVEVLSPSNTEAEMENKLKEYFSAGVRLVWYIDPKTLSARVFTSPDNSALLDENGTLDGANVLPGFKLSLRELFGRVKR